MAHEFTSLSLADHDCFCNMTQGIYPLLHPFGISKLPQSLIPTENQLVERSVIERPSKLKAVVISYDLWMSLKTEKILSLTAHYCTGPDRDRNLTLGYRPPLLMMVFPRICLLWRRWRISDRRRRLRGLRVMAVEIFGFVGRQWIQNTPMTLFPHTPHPIPYSPWSDLRIYWQGLARREYNQSSWMMVRLTRN